MHVYVHWHTDHDVPISTICCRINLLIIHSDVIARWSIPQQWKLTHSYMQRQGWNLQTQGKPKKADKKYKLYESLQIKWNLATLTYVPRSWDRGCPKGISEWRNGGFIGRGLHKCAQLVIYELFRMCMRVLSHVWLSVTPWTVAHQALLSMGFSRQEHWSGLLFPSPGDLPDPGIEPKSLVSPALAGGFFTTAPLGKFFIKL